MNQSMMLTLSTPSLSFHKKEKTSKKKKNRKNGQPNACMEECTTATVGRHQFDQWMHIPGTFHWNLPALFSGTGAAV